MYGLGVGGHHPGGQGDDVGEDAAPYEPGMSPCKSGPPTRMPPAEDPSERGPCSGSRWRTQEEDHDSTRSWTSSSQRRCGWPRIDGTRRRSRHVR